MKMREPYIREPDPTGLTPEQTYDYIFSQASEIGGLVRWHWIDPCLLGDIRTALDGTEWCYPDRELLQAEDGRPRGGGNLAFPIMICTGIDLLSDLYVGCTEYTKSVNMPGKKKAYDHAKAAAEFIAQFFEGPFAYLGRTMWDGLRNGLTHTYAPKPMRCIDADCVLWYTLLVDDPRDASCIRRFEDGYQVQVNVFEFYSAFCDAVGRYKALLEACAVARQRFVCAWSAIESHKRETKGEEYKAEAAWLVGHMEGKELTLLFEMLPGYQ